MFRILTYTNLMQAIPVRAITHPHRRILPLDAIRTFAYSQNDESGTFMHYPAAAVMSAGEEGSRSASDQRQQVHCRLYRKEYR